MLQNELRDNFIKILNGKNFVTPEIVEYVEVDIYICEISKGNIFDKNIYGVTVVNTDTRKHEMDLSTGGFETLELAHEYIHENIGD